ncbi:MAG: hypothetical protein KIT16_15610, partial [Rhodospirillaceae bacterium]|nr:hypothetical protein [Rhodospirillaceae bacterium]
MSPTAAVVAGGHHTREIVYTVGRYGMDMTGGILVLVRMISDLGGLQTKDPAAPNYVSATCSDPAVRLLVEWDKNACERPFRFGVRVTVVDRPLAAGESITVVLGDRRRGSPGWVAQTFAEQECDLRVMADCFASNRYELLHDRLCFPVLAGPATRLELVLPSVCRAGEEVSLLLRAEDKFGNPAETFAGTVALEAPGVEGLPARLDFRPGPPAAMRIAGLRASKAGVLRVAATAG